MKNLIFVLLTLFCLSCKKDSKEVTQLEESRRAWVAYKQTIFNSYSYIRYGGSVFNFNVETKIIVKNGKVIGREYVAWRLKPNNERDTTAAWTENASSLNSHTEGAPSFTLDEVYTDCKANYIDADRKKNDVYFETDTRGLIATCGYVPKGCNDDCFNGVHIKSIVQIPQIVLF